MNLFEAKADRLSFVKEIYPLKETKVSDYHFLDFEESLEFKEGNFYCFWTDEIMKELLDAYSEQVSNLITREGELIYVSFFLNKKSSKTIFLYNVGHIFKWAGERVKEILKGSPCQVFLMLRELFLPFEIDLARCKTISQTASVLFRKVFLKKVLYPPDYRVRRMALESSYGDLRQVFEVGDFKGAFQLYDAQSFYPKNVVSLKFFPLGCNWKQCLSESEFLDEKNLGGFARVWFENRGDYWLIGKKFGSELEYSNNDFAVITLAEYRAYRGNVKFDFVEGFAFAKGHTYLYDYEKYLLELREKFKNDFITQLVLKQLGNLIVGKFLQRGVKRSIESVRKICRKYHLPFSLAYNSIMEDEFEKLTYRIGALYCPEYYSLITGFGRSIQMQAIGLASAFCSLSDSVITLKQLGQMFRINQHIYKVKNYGNRLMVLSPNEVILEGKNPKVVACGYTLKSFPQLKQLFLKKLEKRLDRN